LGVSVTLGYGVSQFAAGIHNITDMEWLIKEDGNPTNIAMILALVIVMFFST
jgi:choline-glycine betaine transporter